VKDCEGSGDGSKCLVNKAFEQSDGLTSTLSEKIINKIEQLKVNPYPDSGFKSAMARQDKVYTY
jgi:hypothetical protein